jgi:hypothetical protein
MFGLVNIFRREAVQAQEQYRTKLYRIPKSGITCLLATKVGEDQFRLELAATGGFADRRHMPERTWNAKTAKFEVSLTSGSTQKNILTSTGNWATISKVLEKFESQQVENKRHDIDLKDDSWSAGVPHFSTKEPAIYKAPGVGGPVLRVVKA